jgi:hypothetical protein
LLPIDELPPRLDELPLQALLPDDRLRLGAPPPPLNELPRLEEWLRDDPPLNERLLDDPPPDRLNDCPPPPPPPPDRLNDRPPPPPPPRLDADDRSPPPRSPPELPPLPRANTSPAAKVTIVTITNKTRIKFTLPFIASSSEGIGAVPSHAPATRFAFYIPVNCFHLSLPGPRATTE